MSTDQGTVGVAQDASSSSPWALVGRLLLDGHAIDGAVVIADGRIVAVETPADLDRLPTPRLHAPFVAPGLIDLQINGGFGFEVGPDAHALAQLAARLPATGVTAFLPTLVSRREGAYAEAFAAFDAATARNAQAPTAARILGLHLEGPLLSLARAGAHDVGAIDAADAALVDRLGDPARVRLVTLAPERSGATALVARLVARGVVVALGHTDASFEAFTIGVDAGARVATHVFNAMSPFAHRAPGAIGGALTDDRVVALAIADGVHAHFAAVRLAVRAKGLERIGLVTDAVAGAGCPPGTTTLAGKTVTVDETSARLADGTLAGSTLTLDRAVRNVAAFAGLTPAAAVQLASAVPASVLGLRAQGRLSVGADGDIVLFDHDLHVLATFVRGVLAYRRADFPGEDGGRRADQRDDQRDDSGGGGDPART
jgi:N-acetylglucosamine-6-phosphate deacetylase